MRNHSRKCRGFMFADAMLGLTVVSAIAVVLSAAVGREHTAEERLADVRAANRTAERALLNLQSQQPVPMNLDVKVHTLPDAAPSGFTWANVEANINGRHASLIGLIPATGGHP